MHRGEHERYYRQTDIQTNIQTDIQRDKQTDRHTWRDRHTQTDQQTDRQTDRATKRLTVESGGGRLEVMSDSGMSGMSEYIPPESSSGSAMLV